MTERYSNTRHNDDDDDQLLDVSSDILDEPVIDINSPDDKDSETQSLLDGREEQKSTKDTIRCSNIPARYVTAVWIFLGFFCLYAMRVNLSVAVVAMVRILLR